MSLWAISLAKKDNTMMLTHAFSSSHTDTHIQYECMCNVCMIYIFKL